MKNIIKREEIDDLYKRVGLNPQQERRISTNLNRGTLNFKLKKTILDGRINTVFNQSKKNIK